MASNIETVIKAKRTETVMLEILTETVRMASNIETVILAILTETVRKAIITKKYNIIKSYLITTLVFLYDITMITTTYTIISIPTKGITISRRC